MQCVIFGEPGVFISQKPLVWYRWYCNKCHLKGKTTDRNFHCHDGFTRIVLADEEDLL